MIKSYFFSLDPTPQKKQVVTPNNSSGYNPPNKIPYHYPSLEYSCRGGKLLSVLLQLPFGQAKEIISLEIQKP